MINRFYITNKKMKMTKTERLESVLSPNNKNVRVLLFWTK